MSAPLRGPAIPPFYAGEVGRRAARLHRQGRHVVQMHYGQPSEGAPPSAIAAAEAALRGGGASIYWESAALRERIARHYADTQGVVVSPDRILLTSGASAGLVALFTTLFGIGDRIGVVRPGYPAYRNALTALGRVAVDIDGDPAHGLRLTPVRLSSTLASSPGGLQGLIIASPNNPTGAVHPEDELASLAAQCRAAGVRLISDEIYHGISFGRATRTALAFDDDAFVVNSFSKFFRMPGWRLGWVVAPADCVAALSAHLTNFFLTPSTMSQHAALGAFDDLPALHASVDIYRRNAERLAAELPGLGIDRFVAPEGAFYLYADLSAWTNDSLAFCMRLLDDTGLSIAPGIDFDPVDGHRFVRFSYAISPAMLDEALDILRRWLPAQPHAATITRVPC